MTIPHEILEVLLVNTQHLNRDNLGKQVLGLKEKIAFVPLNKNITQLNKHDSCFTVPPQPKQKVKSII